MVLKYAQDIQTYRRYETMVATYFCCLGWQVTASKTNYYDFCVCHPVSSKWYTVEVKYQAPLDWNPPRLVVETYLRKPDGSCIVGWYQKDMDLLAVVGSQGTICVWYWKGALQDFFVSHWHSWEHHLNTYWTVLPDGRCWRGAFAVVYLSDIPAKFDFLCHVRNWARDYQLT